MDDHRAESEVLHDQQRHWERMYGENADMFGKEPSYPALRAADVFSREGAKKVLELGSGQGRDTLFFARHGFHIYALDYSEEGLEAIQKRAEAAGLCESITTVRHDARDCLPFDDNTFDGCYSHMLYCMALTTPELEFLSREIYRVLKPSGVNIYTVRHTGDPHYRTGIDRGDDMWEIGGGFIVHFFSRETVAHLAERFEATNIEEFEETDLPKKLFLVTQRKT